MCRQETEREVVSVCVPVLVSVCVPERDRKRERESSMELAGVPL